MLLSPSKKDIREQFLYMSMLLFFVLLCLMTLGLVSNALFPGDTTSLVIPQMIQYILPVGLRGFAYAGLFAITMATFDSYLHAAGLSLVHDVIAPICERNNQKIDELMVTRCVTLLIGCVVILLGALHITDLYSFVATSYIFIGPLLAFPLFAGVLGLKPDQCAFYTAFIGTIIALALCKCLLPTHYAYWTGIIGVCVNGMLFLGIHAIRNKGFSIVKYEDTETQDVDLA